MKLAFGFLIFLPFVSMSEPILVGGVFGEGESSQISDLAVRSDGAIIACGTLGDGSSIPGATAVRQLFPGEHESGQRGFIAQFGPDLSSFDWIATFPSDCIQPSRIALGKDGFIAIGGRHLGQLAIHDAKQENWAKSRVALARLAPDGSKVLWVSPGGPNQDSLTGLDVDTSNRVYFTAGSGVRQAANYILRKNGETGKNEPWEKTGWCVYLHTNQEALKAEGQFLSYYEMAKKHSENGFGFDYDGEGGWGPVNFSLQGFRIGGDVRVLPDGDIAVSSCLQYDFRANERTEAETSPVRKGKSYPAFDYFLARYSPDGELRWSTNLYQSGDSVHTPDQKPIDLIHDPKTDSIYVLAKQHGSNLYRFKGNLAGDTGNLMISWVGKVAARTGKLDEGWYFQNNRTGKFGANGVPRSPPYPKLAGNALRRIALGGDGSVYLAGSGGARTWTTPDALQAWPPDQDGGGEGVLLKLSPDLAGVDYATCLFSDAAESFEPRGLGVAAKGVVLAGSGAISGLLAGKVRRPDWSRGGEAAGCLILLFQNEAS